MAFNFGAFKSIAIADAAPFIPKEIYQIVDVLGLGVTVPGGPSSANWDRVPVEITVKDATNNTFIQLPVIPQQVNYGDGGAITDTVKILNVGNIEFPSGVELDTLSWESFFPGRYDAGYCTTPALKTPVDYRNWFSTWKDQSLPVQVIIPAFDINKTMKVSAFTWRGEGFEGDIYYAVTFKEYKTAAPRQVETGGTLPEKGKKIPQERPAVGG